MILRNSNTGGLEVYDVNNNNITNAASIGAIGLEWQLMGFGNFSSLGETDMMLRNVNTGGIEVCDIRNNQITSVPFIGTVGVNWQFSGVGNFGGLGESDMLLRNSNTGGLEVYDIANNAITNAASIGAIASSGNSRASAISAACPAKPISCCATPIPAGWRCTTSTITNSPAPLSSGRSGWSGSSPASPRYTHLARPISCCATKIPVHSRPTTSATT